MWAVEFLYLTLLVLLKQLFSCYPQVWIMAPKRPFTLRLGVKQFEISEEEYLNPGKLLDSLCDQVSMEGVFIVSFLVVILSVCFSFLDIMFAGLCLMLCTLFLSVCSIVGKAEHLE